LARLETELARHGGRGNAAGLTCTYSDFEAYGIHRHAIAAAIRECVALGLLEIMQLGCAGNADFKAPNRYRLTYINSLDIMPTHEWRKLKTVEDAQAAANVARAVHPSEGKRHWE
jgi:hypothetical protein